MIAIVGDIHLKTNTYVNKLHLIERVIEYCKDNYIHNIIFLGDLFDSYTFGDKNLPPDKFIKGLTEVLSKAHNINIYCIEGNHDQGTKSDTSALNYIHLSNFTAIQSKQVLDLDCISVACIPWQPNNKNYMEETLKWLNSITPTNKVRLLAGHFNVIGCSLGSHHYITPDLYYSFGLPDLLRTYYKPTHSLIGHLHKKTQLEDTHWLSGPLSQCNFAEEGASAGFWTLDFSGNMNFIDLTQYATDHITIHDDSKFEKLYNYKNLFRVYTDIPEKYKQYSNVKAIRNKNVYISQEAVDIKSDSLSLPELIKKYCIVKKVEEPTSEFYKSKLNDIQLNLNKSNSGLSRFKNLHISNLGKKNNGQYIHKNTNIKFNDGITIITGRNGVGKTILLETLYAGIYDFYPERGNIKNYLENDSFINLDIEVNGVNHKIEKKVIKKRFLSYLDDTTYELVSQFREAIIPIVGDSDTFSKLVLMDQNNTFDLVTADDAPRLALLRKLFNLDSFDKAGKIFSEELAEAKRQLDRHNSLKEEIEELKNNHDSITYEILEFDVDNLKKLEQRYNALIQLKQKQEKHKLYLKKKEYCLQFEQDNNIEELEANYKQYNTIKSQLHKMKTATWDNIGCASNPLPCKHLKALNWTEEEKRFLENQLVNLEKLDFNSYNTYKVYKAEPDSNLNFGEVVSDSQLLELSKEIASAKASSQLVEANNKLKRTKDNLLVTINKKIELLGDIDTKTLENQIKDLKFLQELCSKTGLSLYVIKLLTQELQEVIDELIQYSELDIKITLGTNKNKELDGFKILFGEEQFDIKKASNGQQSLVKILFKWAVMLYLNRYFGNYKVMLMDEPTAFLDEDNVEAFNNIVKKLTKEFNQIIIVTHSPKVAEIGDNIISL